MLTWLKKQKEQILSPILDWVQIEVTSYCNAACIYCPHTLAREGWLNAHFPLTLLHDLLPSLSHTNLVFLQGWGEPFLHPDLFEMVRLCKNQGKKVGFTTNGMLLNKKNIHTIVDLQVDILGVSFAGTTPSTHNRIRKGTDFETVVAALEYLRRIKAEKKTTKPAIHLAYIMLASNFDELSRITSLAKNVGAEQVVASNLTLIQEPQLFQEALFNNPQRLNEYSRTLVKIKKEAAANNVLFAYRDPALDETSCVCPENVCRACVINVAGEVGPCVFTNPILSGTGSSGKAVGKQMMAIFKDQPVPLETFSFGNIKNIDLVRIWGSKKYREFRNLFDPKTRLLSREILAGMPPSCKTCYKRSQVSDLIYFTVTRLLTGNNLRLV
ncbi:MAG: radical SAM/SPASM domain-containing protein [Thermodesulfobacteriota bacterium]|nr:radical SAM/SPASM domain-containing protein [Thermodesulfobacteriota bacterium]